MKKTSLLFFLFLYIHSFGQGDNFQPKGSITADLGIPTQGKNNAFGLTMEGLFNGGVGYQYNVFQGLTLGAGVKYSFFILNTFALNNVNWSGSVHMPSAYGRLAYEKFTSERFSFTLGLRGGYTAMFSSHGNDSCKVGTAGEIYKRDTYFLEPQLELLLLTDKTSPHGFNFIVGYTMIFEEYGPEYLCLDAFPGLLAEDYVGITRFMSFGFGYRYYFQRN